MYTLLTGATGLVGRYLMRDLLLNGHELAVVVRPSRKLSCRERIEEILLHWEAEMGRPLPRPVVIEGNICDPGFGFSDSDREWVLNNCRCIIHSAAILEFYGKDRKGEPWRTNLDGTRHMIDLCRELRIHDIHYVSTAYVAGMQDGVVREDQLDVGQTFRNDYEQSKFEAETLVRNIDFAQHVTVYRPAVIAGDSVTGYTNTYHGIYLYLRLMAMLIPSVPRDEDGYVRTPIRLRMTGDERRNIIPVDWVSAVTVRLFETEEARGGTYHIAPPNPISSGQIIRYCEEYFKTKGVQFCGDIDKYEPVSREQDEDQWLFEQMYVENMSTYEPYERTDNDYDLTNMQRFAGDIPCPDIDRTVMHRFIDYGNADRWGKRKISRPEVALWVSDLLAELPGATAASVAESVDSIAADLTGAGGCQLTLYVAPDGALTWTRGLADGAARLVQAAAEDVVSTESGLEALLSKLNSGADTGVSGSLSDRPGSAEIPV